LSETLGLRLSGVFSEEQADADFDYVSAELISERHLSNAAGSWRRASSGD
jgi:hypothetical protein